MQFPKLTHAVGAAAIASLALSGTAFAQNPEPNVVSPQHTNFTFKMVPTGGGEPCIPGATGLVTITHTPQLVETMHVDVKGLPPNTDFDLFVIQVPAFPFGLSWYMGDMLTDSTGEAVGDFIGRFNIGTFIVAPGVASAPVVLPGPRRMEKESCNFPS